MARAPFHILVLPYFVDSKSTIEYVVLRRSDSEEKFWQGIAGGGEDDESPEEAARRKMFEEAGISTDSKLLELRSVPSVPVTSFKNVAHWDPDLFVIPEYCFGVELINKHLELSYEHTEYRWLPHDEAASIFKYDSNRIALWELDQRLKKQRI